MEINVSVVGFVLKNVVKSNDSEIGSDILEFEEKLLVQDVFGILRSNYK